MFELPDERTQQEPRFEPAICIIEVVLVVLVFYVA